MAACTTPARFAVDVETESVEFEALLADWVDHKHFDELDSTQSFVEREHETFDQSRLTAVSADFQTAGRGTGERAWQAKRADSVLVTFFFRFPSDCSNDFVNRSAPNVTKVLAIAAVQTLQWATPGQELEFGIKWPNDIIVSGCKVGGILARAVPFSGRLEGIIIGVGLNINTPKEVLEQIERPVWPAGSLFSASGRTETFDVASIRRRLLGTFAMQLRRFFQGGFAIFYQHVNSLDVLLGSKVRFRVHASEEFDCVFEGIQEDGLIVLRLETGEVAAFPSGEIVPKLQS